MGDNIEKTVSAGEILNADVFQELDEEYEIKDEVDSLRENENNKQCPYTSSTKLKLNQHIQGVHEKVKSYACKECQYETSWKTTLNRHIKRWHSKGGKEFKCEECSYATDRKDNLKAHFAAAHSNGDSNVCGECGYTFSRKSNLK